MTLNFKEGDVIMTQEIQQIPLSRLGNKNISHMTLYGIPADLEAAARAALEPQDGLTTLGRILPSGSIVTEDGKEYPLTRLVWISTSYSMAWFVQKIDGDNLTLVAIGQNRDAREKDFALYQTKYSQERLPSLEEYMTADVMVSFLKGKAVHTFTNGEISTQIY